MFLIFFEINWPSTLLQICLLYCCLLLCSVVHVFTVVDCVRLQRSALLHSLLYVPLMCNVYFFCCLCSDGSVHTFTLFHCLWRCAYFYCWFFSPVMYTCTVYCFCVVQCIRILLFPCGTIHTVTVDCFRVLSCIFLLLIVSVWYRAHFYCWVFSVVQCISMWWTAYLFRFCFGVVQRTYRWFTFAVDCFRVVWCLLLLINVFMWCRTYLCFSLLSCGAVHTFTVVSVWWSAFFYYWFFTSVAKCMLLPLFTCGIAYTFGGCWLFPCGTIHTFTVVSVWSFAHF